MNDRLIPEGGCVITLAVIAIIISIIAFIASVWLYINRPEPEQDRIVPKATVDKMKRHGIHTSYEDWKGNEYFIREGKRCRL